MLPFHRFALDVWQHQILTFNWKARRHCSSYPTTTNIHVTNFCCSCPYRAKHVQRNTKHMGSSFVKLSWDMHLIDWLFQQRLMNQNTEIKPYWEPSGKKTAFKFSTQNDTVVLQGNDEWPIKREKSWKMPAPATCLPKTGHFKGKI